jgi:hypothetical protein
MHGDSRAAILFRDVLCSYLQEVIARAMIAALALAAVLSGAAAPARPLPDDVARNHWAAGAIGKLLALDLLPVPPDALYHGEKPVDLPFATESLSRLAQVSGVPGPEAPACLKLDQVEARSRKRFDRYALAVLIVQALDCAKRWGKDLTRRRTAAPLPADIPEKHVARTAVNRAMFEYSLMGGYPDRTYRGDKGVSRYEFAALLAALLDRIEEEPGPERPAR